MHIPQKVRSKNSGCARNIVIDCFGFKFRTIKSWQLYSRIHIKDIDYKHQAIVSNRVFANFVKFSLLHIINWNI